MFEEGGQLDISEITGGGVWSNHQTFYEIFFFETFPYLVLSRIRIQRNLFIFGANFLLLKLGSVQFKWLFLSLSSPSPGVGKQLHCATLDSSHYLHLSGDSSVMHVWLYVKLNVIERYGIVLTFIMNMALLLFKSRKYCISFDPFHLTGDMLLFENIVTFIIEYF